MTTSTRPSLERKPGGPDNWVEKVGGLPSYIDLIARAVHQEANMDVGHAIATAVNAVKKMCATGDLNFPGKQNVKTITKAQACKAVAEWEAKKARARSLANPYNEFTGVMLAAMRLTDVIDLATPMPDFIAKKVAETKAAEGKGGAPAAGGAKVCKTCGKPATKCFQKPDGSMMYSCDAHAAILGKGGKAVPMGGAKPPAGKGTSPATKSTAKGGSKPPWDMVSDGVGVLEMHMVRAGEQIDLAKIRRVRTPAGVAWYKQPIGSIIIPDVVPGKPGRVLSVGQPVNAGGKSGRILDVTPDGEHLAVRHDDGTVRAYRPDAISAPGGERQTNITGPQGKAGNSSATPGSAPNAVSGGTPGNQPGVASRNERKTRVASNAAEVDPNGDKSSNNRLGDETPDQRRERNERRKNKRETGRDETDEERKRREDEEEAQRRKDEDKNKKDKDLPDGGGGAPGGGGRRRKGGGGGPGGPGLPHLPNKKDHGGKGGAKKKGPAAKKKGPAAKKTTPKKAASGTGPKAPPDATAKRSPVGGRTPSVTDPIPATPAGVTADLRALASPKSSDGGTGPGATPGSSVRPPTPGAAGASVSQTPDGRVLVSPGPSSTASPQAAAAALQRGREGQGYTTTPAPSGRGLIVAAKSAPAEGSPAPSGTAAPGAATGSAGGGPAGRGSVASSTSGSPSGPSAPSAKAAGGLSPGGEQGSPSAGTAVPPTPAPVGAGRTSAVQMQPTQAGQSARARDEAAVQKALQEKNPQAAIAPLRRMLNSPGLSEPEKTRMNALLTNAQQNAPGAADPSRPESPQLNDFLTPQEQARFADLTSPSTPVLSPQEATALSGMKGNYLARKAGAAGVPEPQARQAVARGNALLAGVASGDPQSMDRIEAAVAALGAPLATKDGGNPTGQLQRAMRAAELGGGSRGGEAGLDQLAAAMQMEWTNAAISSGPGGKINLHRAVYGDQGRQLIDAAATGVPWTAESRAISSWAELIGMPSVDAWLERNQGVAWLSQEIGAEKVYAFWRVEPALRHPDTFALGEYLVIGAEVDSGQATVASG